MGRVYLADFGLARHQCDAAPHGSGSAPTKLTATGAMLGTPAYMSPELARGELAALTPASDVWALGCVLHECLSGRRAFDGDSPAATLGAVLAAAPSPLPALPAPAARLVAACLQRRPARRYPRAGPLRDDAERVLAGERPLARPPRPRLALAVAALAALGLVGALGLAWSGRDAGSASASPDDALAAEIERAWADRHTEPDRALARLQAALARAPGHQALRLQVGLLQWAADREPSAAVATWSGIPPGDPHYVRAQWYVGLAWTAVRVASDDATSSADTVRAWQAAAAGTGPEAGWARIGLATRDGGGDARAQLPTAGDWSACLLRGLLENKAGDQGDPRAGAEAYTQALAGGVPFAWAYVNRAIWRRALDDLDGARADAERALALDPRLPQAWNARGTVRQAQGDAAGAVADFGQCLALDPRRAAAWNNRGTAREALGDLAGAIEDYGEAITRDPGAGLGWHNRGLARQRAGNAAGARADFDAALQRDPTLAGAWASRGVLRQTQRDWAGAIADFDRAHALAPQRADVLCNRGLTRLQQGDAARAVADFDGALALDDGYAKAWSGRAIARQWQQDLAGAIADFGRALQIDPTDATTWYNRGNAHKLRKDLAAAVADYDAAIERRADYAQAWINRGQVRVMQGDAAGAIPDLERGLALAPREPAGYANRAAAHLALGHYAEAIRDYEHALAVAPPAWPARGAVERALDHARAGGTVEPGPGASRGR